MPFPARHILSATALPVLAVCALAACQTTPSTSQFAYGQVRLEQCIAAACTELGLDNAPLRDYAQVAGLSHVTALMLGFTEFADLGDIAAMGQLEELHIGSTQVRDLSGLAAFPNLRLLHMQWVEPTSLAPLAGLRNLRELAIGHAGLSDLSIIAQMPGLQRLHLTHADDRTDLASLGRHPGLQSVHIASDAIGDLSPLLRLPALREVSMEAYSDTRHADVIAQLRARGVRVTLTEPVVIVC